MNEMSQLQPTLADLVGVSTGPMPASLYTDPNQYELERERIFRRAWLMVGREERIVEPGQFFVKDIAILSASIIITRAKDGQVRAFHNVCSHRGNHVVLEPEGKANRFACRYHGWTYKNTGELIGVPDESGFFDFDKKKCGLTPVACDIWDGWIFINFQPRPEVGLMEFLGSFGTEFADIPYPHADNCLILSGEINANWKCLADNFSEFYHIQSIHPKTLAPVYAGKDNPCSRPLDAGAYGAHRSVAGWLNIGYQPPANWKVVRWLYPANQTVTGTQKEGEVNPLAEHPMVNHPKRKDWSSDVNWIFPNWHIQISASRFWTHEFWPRNRSQSSWEARFYQPKATTVRERLQLEHFTATITDTFLEDLANIESTQKGMESGAKSFVYLHESEILIRHSLEQVDKWTRAKTMAEALD
ncbi:dioxygenase [Sphingobium sp. C100]|uniref:aromatic ring-hydroxylating oxygenase subunit alpha n=1 Tax=Sphingobium sp. C100 TaxID=1207055 RepID=UPI0003D5A381|nr:aromatic ring-hydroxylating dioxygenase subunit alpha [Sphingobium sp. C100]ETI65787.1 dioxygenase [Sphingobium sp. C100]